MQISVTVMDRDGNELNIGDMIQLYDWDGTNKALGFGTIIWDADEGRINTEPCIVEDAHDFWTKAIPRCKKFRTIID